MTLYSKRDDETTSTATPLIIDFFHDAVCGWCYVMSPRLRKVAEEIGVQVHHRTYILQDSREQMVQVFGSMARAKREILTHWEACAKQDDSQSIDIEGMRQQGFEYPNGLLAAIACQAAHILAGNLGHGDYFDAVQRAHLTQSRNIGDPAVLQDIAVAQGFDSEAFRAAFKSEAAYQRVVTDRQEAQKLGIRSVPTLIISSPRSGDVLGQLQTTSTEQLKSSLQAMMSLTPRSKA